MVDGQSEDIHSGGGMPEQIRILALGDEEEVRQTLNSFLAGDEFSLHQASGFEEARRLVEQYLMDVLILDTSVEAESLPRMIRTIQRLSPSIQVLLISEHPLFASWKDRAAAGLLDELIKPVSNDVLHRVVLAAVRLKEIQSENLRLQQENLNYQQHLEDLVERRTRALSRSRDKLEQSQMRYQAVMRSTPHGLCMLTPDWRFEFGNTALNTLVNPSSNVTQEMLGVSFESMFPDAASFANYARAAVQQIRRQGIDVRDVQLRRLDGTRFWCEISIVRHDPGSTQGGFVATLTDITEKRRAREQLLEAAFYDPLTNLPNRKLFLDQLQEAISGETAGVEFTILFLDLDRFKNINDSMGHLAGDELLQKVSLRLVEVTRHGDLVARLGGDEFVFLVHAMGEEITRVGERILNCFTRPFQVRGQEVFINASIGAAPCAAEYQTHEEMLRDADAAMYDAKARGRGCVSVFDMRMRDEAQRALHLETDLRNALLKSEFFVEYQPILCSSSRRLEGFEALVRWRQNDGTVLYPRDFIREAEENGLIIPIGAWVLEQACGTLSEWKRRYPDCENLMMAVNVSPRQFAHPEFLSLVKHVLEETALEPSSLVLEIVESVITEGPDRVQTVFKRLRSLGVSLYLDDFGMGYSSLSYLQKFPLDALKIDRSFVAAIDEHPMDRKLLGAIAAVGRALNLRVVVEGIEKESILSAMDGVSFDLAQGYYFHPPLERGAAEDLVEGHSSSSSSSLKV